MLKQDYTLKLSEFCIEVLFLNSRGATFSLIVGLYVTCELKLHYSACIYVSCISVTSSLILHFIVVCLVAKPLNRSNARVDFVVIQTLLLFVCKSLCYHVNYFCVSIISRSPLTSLSYEALVTFHRTVKYSI